MRHSNAHGHFHGLSLIDLFHVDVEAIHFTFRDAPVPSGHGRAKSTSSTGRDHSLKAPIQGD